MQSQGVGPALPQPKAAPVPPSLEPAAKRPRIDAVTHVEAPPITHVAAPNVPPPPGFENAAEAASAADEPFASIGTGAAVSPKEAAGELLPEAEFAASLSKPEVTLQVRVPNDRTNMAYNFYGQIVSLSVNVMSTIKTVKQELSKAHLNSMPPNKMQLKNPATGAFLKDNTTLAAQNIGPSATLELVPRARGGRR